MTDGIVELTTRECENLLNADRLGYCPDGFVIFCPVFDGG
jgi:hypothetical protein